MGTHGLPGAAGPGGLVEVLLIADSEDDHRGGETSTAGAFCKEVIVDRGNPVDSFVLQHAAQVRGGMPFGGDNDCACGDAGSLCRMNGKRKGAVQVSLLENGLSE